MMPDWPALLALDPAVQYYAAILTFEAHGMKVPVHGPDSRSFGLSFLWYYGLLTGTAYMGKLLGVVLNTVDAIFPIHGETFVLQVHSTNLTFEAGITKYGIGGSDPMALYVLLALATLVHAGHVVLLTENFAIK